MVNKANWKLHNYVRGMKLYKNDVNTYVLQLIENGQPVYVGFHLILGGKQFVDRVYKNNRMYTSPKFVEKYRSHPLVSEALRWYCHDYKRVYTADDVATPELLDVHVEWLNFLRHVKPGSEFSFKLNYEEKAGKGGIKKIPYLDMVDIDDELIRLTNYGEKSYLALLNYITRIEWNVVHKMLYGRVRGTNNIVKIGFEEEVKQFVGNTKADVEILDDNQTVLCRTSYNRGECMAQVEEAEYLAAILQYQLP